MKFTSSRNMSFVENILPPFFSHNLNLLGKISFLIIPRKAASDIEIA